MVTGIGEHVASVVKCLALVEGSLVQHYTYSTIYSKRSLMLIIILWGVVPRDSWTDVEFWGVRKLIATGNLLAMTCSGST